MDLRAFWILYQIQLRLLVHRWEVQKLSNIDFEVAIVLIVWWTLIVKVGDIQFIYNNAKVYNDSVSKYYDWKDIS